MLRKIKYFCLQLKLKLLPNLFSSKDMHYILREKGVSVGEGTFFYAPGKSTIDISRPCLLRIGAYCKITSGVIILTHDYSRSVLRRVYGVVIGEGQETIIGDNVFIGMNAIILMGSRIGSNVIIGAGSIVSGEIPDNVVVAGSPARVIRTLDEHYAIRQKKALQEAVEYVLLFKKGYGRIPTVKELEGFSWLFLQRDMNQIIAHGINMRLGGDEEEEVIAGFFNSKPLFDGYEAFIKHIEVERND